MKMDNTTTIDIDDDGEPTGTTTVSPAAAMASTISQPVRVNMQTTVQSPFFWIVVGAGLAALGYWFVKRKIQ